MKSKLIAGFVALGVFGAGVAWWGMSGPRELASIGSGAYAFSYDFSLDLAQAPAGKLTSRVQGTLHLAESDGQMRARLQVADLQTKTPEGSKLGLLGDNPKQQLQSRFVVVREKDGAIREVLLPENLSLSVRSILAAAVNHSQYVQAPGAEVKAWASQERNANGTFKAKYTFAGDDKVKKVWKLGTTKGLGGVNGQSKAHFTLEGPRVKKVRVSQQGNALTGNQRSPFSLRLTLERVGDADTRYIEEGDDSSDDSNENSSQAGPLLAFTTKAATPKNLKVASHDPRPLGELMTALSKVTADDSLKQATALRAELTEAVVRSPEVALALDQLLRLETVVVFQARYAVEALLGARMPHSDLLAAKLIIDKSLSQTSHTMLMAGAALLDSPTPKVVAAVRHVMHTEKDRAKKGRATLALSGLASHIRQSETFRKQDSALLGSATLPAGGTVTELPTDVAPTPAPTPVDSGQPEQGEAEPPTWEVPTEAEELPGAAELEAEIIEEARFVLEELPSSTFAWKVSVIRALGNLGTDACMPLVRTAFEDENLLVRAAAATALRHQDPANVMEDLQKALNDTELEVRSAAVKAARKMGPAATKALVQSVLFFDKSEYVRLQAVYTFGAWSHEAPAVINTLVQAEEHEKSPKVMQAIRHMRHKNRIEPPFVQNPLPEEDQ